METAIGVFTSRDRAELALKELLEHKVPDDSIVFLTRSESEAMALGKEIGTMAGGLTGGTVGLSAGMVVASLAIIPGIGQIFAVGVGAVAVLGFLGSKAGEAAGKHFTKDKNVPAHLIDKKAEEDQQLFLEVLKAGRSLIVVRTESAEIAKVAAGILDRDSGAKPAPSTASGKMQTVVRKSAAGVTSLDVKGRVAVGEGSVMLREAVERLVSSGDRHVVMVLREVDYIDSSGIGELVRAHTLLRKSSGHMKIADPSSKVHEMLQMTMLHKVFDVHPTESSALDSFGNLSTAKA